MISLTTIINKNVSSLTKSDIIICDYFTENSHVIPEMTLQQLAQETFSSKSNVLRLIKKLDFSGFTDFKYYLLAQANQTGSQHDFGDILVRLEALDFDFISQEFAQLLEMANNIYLFATGQDQQIQAKNLANYLLKAGIISTFVPLNAYADLTTSIIKGIQPTDLLIVFSSQGNNEILKATFANFSKEDYSLVSFTTFKEGWLQSKADLAITLGIQQFQDPILNYQSGMMHLLLNILSTRLNTNS